MTTIKLRRGTIDEWTRRDPILSLGEPGLTLDNLLLKIGDGVRRWTELPYVGGSGIPGPQGEPGTNGVDGADGRSAYELAVISGFIGTEAQWLLSLKGEPGTAGTPGSPGPKGDTGDIGPAGANGTSYTGPKITTAAVAPSTPSVNDVWIDTSS